VCRFAQAPSSGLRPDKQTGPLFSPLFSPPKRDRTPFLSEGADTIDVQEASLSDGIDSVIGTEMTDTVFTDPADLLI
jgi:hypothetical protein